MNLHDCLAKWEELDWRGNVRSVLWDVMSDYEKWMWWYTYENIYICNGVSLDDPFNFDKKTKTIDTSGWGWNIPLDIKVGEF